MKKIFGLFLAMAMLLLFTACAEEKVTAPTTKSTEPTTLATESATNSTDGTQGTAHSNIGVSPTESTPTTTTQSAADFAVTNSTATEPSTSQPTATRPSTTEPALTPPDTSELEKQIFIQLYKHEEAEYLLSILRQVSPLEQELAELKQEASDNYVRYMQEKQQITNRFEAMGMLNSGAYQGALKTNEDNYKATSQQLTKQIDSLESQIATLKNEQSNPSVSNVLMQLANNNNMTYAEAMEKYNKYMG